MVTTIRGGEPLGPIERDLGEFDIFVRDATALSVVYKVLPQLGSSVTDILTGQTPFGLLSNFSQFSRQPKSGFVRLYMQGGDAERWVDPSMINRNEGLIDAWKVLTPKAGPGNSGGHVIPDMVLGRPLVAEPGSVCTQTYLVAGPLTNRSECESLASYLRTKFVRFLVSLRKPSQDANRGVYRWVPQQAWDRVWTDRELYSKYELTVEEAAYIESVIRPMGDADE